MQRPSENDHAIAIVLLLGFVSLPIPIEHSMDVFNHCVLLETRSLSYDCPCNLKICNY